MNIKAFAIPLLLCLASLSNLTTAKTVDDVIAQIIAVNETAVGADKDHQIFKSNLDVHCTHSLLAGYASDFSESSFNQVHGIRELEENFFPHEDLVR